MSKAQRNATLPLLATRFEYRRWWIEQTEQPYGYCWCGCGERTKIVSRRSDDRRRLYFRGEPQRYINGHGQRIPTEETLQRYEEVDGPLDTHCWLWSGGRTQRGYGLSSINRADTNRAPEPLAHRFFYHHLRKPIEIGYELHHLCKTPLCVNPKHLVEVTPADHRIQDGVQKLTNAQLTLPSAKAAGFSFLRGSRPWLRLGRLTSSPRAFKVSVCPTATRIKRDAADLVFVGVRVLGSRTRETLLCGKCFTRRPTRRNHQHSVVKERCADSRRARYIIARSLEDGVRCRRFILSLAKPRGGFLASNSVKIIKARLKEDCSGTALAREFGVSQALISAIKCGRLHSRT